MLLLLDLLTTCNLFLGELEGPFTNASLHQIDYKAMMYFTTTLLRQLHAYLSREEQAGLYASLPRILAAAKKSGTTDMSEICYWTNTLVADIEVCS